VSLTILLVKLTAIALQSKL